MNCDQLRAVVNANPLAGWRCVPGDGFLRLETSLRYADGGVIEVFIEERRGTLVVTDYGEAFRFLHTNGIDPTRSATRQQLIEMAAQLAGATLVDDAIEIRVESPSEVVGVAARLGQAIGRIADLSLQGTGPVGKTFSDTLEEFITSNVHGLEVQRGATLQGRAAKHQIDIVVRSQRGISAIEGLSALTATGANAQTAYTIQKFADLAAIGHGAPDRYAVIDDSSDVWTDSLRRQLENFSTVVDWARRDDLLHYLET